MCQYSVFLKEEAGEKEILKDVMLVEPCKEGVKIQDFFRPSKTVPARIAKIDLVKHKIILEPLKNCSFV